MSLIEPRLWRSRRADLGLAALFSRRRFLRLAGSEPPTVSGQRRPPTSSVPTFSEAIWIPSERNLRITLREDLAPALPWAPWAWTPRWGLRQVTQPLGQVASRLVSGCPGRERN